MKPLTPATMISILLKGLIPFDVWSHRDPNSLRSNNQSYLAFASIYPPHHRRHECNRF
ncbi:MAG: hypothetical protein MZU97_00095 [Bacillus subtilis]|nr:hypothetical protein [Bacillus subtilis]